MSETEIKDRILKLLTNENLSSSKFADMVGVQRSSISHILSGRNKPSLDFLQKVLSSFPSINADWLIVGKGEMFKNLRQTEINFNKTENSKIPEQEEKSEIVDKQVIKRETSEFQVSSKPRKVKKVILFYDDNTFEELSPDYQKDN